jgi:hypothetical protein
MASISSRRLAKELKEIHAGCPTGAFTSLYLTAILRFNMAGNELGINLIDADNFERWFLELEVLGESLYKVRVSSFPLYSGRTDMMPPPPREKSLRLCFASRRTTPSQAPPSSLWSTTGTRRPCTPWVLSLYLSIILPSDTLHPEARILKRTHMCFHPWRRVVARSERDRSLRDAAEHARILQEEGAVGGLIYATSNGSSRVS